MMVERSCIIRCSPDIMVMKFIERRCPLSRTRKLRNGTAYSIVFGTPEGTSSSLMRG